LAVKQNQYLNGKQRAFQSFRDVLASQINTTFPELRSDVDDVLENTGGRGDVPTFPTIANHHNYTNEKSPPGQISLPTTNGVLGTGLVGNGLR